MKTVTLCLTLFTAGALAQGKPSLTDYPLDVKASLPEAQATELQDDFRQMLARNPGILVPTRTNWKAAVSALKRQDCDVRNECLQQLAISGATLYALYASVQRNAAGTELTATGRVVNQDGVAARAPVSVTVPKQATFNDAARSALKQLLAKLELEKLSPVLTEPAAPAPATRPPPPTASNEPPPPPPALILQGPQAEPGLKPMRVAAWVTGGAGLAAGVVAAGFGISAIAARGGLPASGHLVDATQARTQMTVNQGATISLVSGVAALALVATSTVLFIASSSGSQAAVGLAPGPDGAALVFGGRF
jgi:hypothetical protein